MVFEDFIYKCFHTICPARELSKNWHIGVIAHHLENISEYKRLIISIPPRCMKSTCVSVAWPAWILGHNPSSNIIVASYSRGLSVKHSLDTRCIMQSAWYKEMFPETILSSEQNTKHKFQTTKRGFRLATSLGGTLTGEGGDILIADDPITPMEAQSVKYRKRVIDWFEQVFVSRLNSLKTGRIVIVMHRVHEYDLINHLCAKKAVKWHKLSFQMIADHSQEIICQNKILYRVEKGQILDEERYNREDIELMKQDIGSSAFAAQYQQNPLPNSSSLVRREYFTRYHSLPEKNYNVKQSWDTGASKEGSYSVGITYAVIDGKIYIIDVFRARLGYGDLKRKVLSLAADYKSHAIFIEEKASGIQLMQELGEQVLPVIGIKPKISKLDRLHKVLPLIEARKLMLPYAAVWLSDFEQELISFPNSEYTDQVDSLTQLLANFGKEVQGDLILKTI